MVPQDLVLTTVMVYSHQFLAGWRINDEAFLRSQLDSDLKIRGSYGTMGNQLAVSPQTSSTPTVVGQSIIL